MSNENKQVAENEKELENLNQEELDQVVGGAGDPRVKRPFEKERPNRLTEA